MYGSYKATRKYITKSPDKSWNVSTRLEKRSHDNYFSGLRKSPDLKRSKIFKPQNHSPEPRFLTDISDSNSRNYSILKEESSKIIKSSYIAKKIKSITFKKDFDRKFKVPNLVSHCIAEIFISASKEPIGLGLLVAEKLMLTSTIAIPNEKIANRCVFRFINDKSYYKSRSDKFFYNSLQFSLSIFAVSRVQKDSPKKHPVRLDSSVQLSLNDVLFCAESTCFRVQVSSINEDSYGISSYFTPVTGSPIFNSSWCLVGIAGSTSMTYKYTECVNILSINSLLSYIRSRFNFNLSQASFNLAEEVPQPKDLKWFEFRGDYVESFDISKGEWLYKRSPCSIPWHCSLVSISEDETIIIGGIKKDIPVDEAIKYNFSRNICYQLASMKTARAYCAAVFYDNIVFVIGGKFANTYCEKYSVPDNKWEYIPPMLNERYDLSAVVLNHAIYVIGGEPRKTIGSLIEKFDILGEIWQEVPTKLPFPLACSPICVIDSFTCGILGGRGCSVSFSLEVSRYHSSDVRLKEGADVNEELESIYPAVYSRDFNKIFILNTAEGFDRPVLYKIHGSYLPHL